MEKEIRLPDFLMPTLGDLGTTSAPKSFLEEHSWKGFLRSSATVAADAQGGIVISLLFFVPRGYSSVDARHVKRTIEYWLSENDQRISKSVGLDPKSRSRVILRQDGFGDLPWDVDGIINGRSLGDWIRLYVNGKAFAIKMSRESEERYIFIEELYQEPRNYRELKASFLEVGKDPTLLIGDPRAGKTYSAVKLLYEAFVDGHEHIFFVQSIENLEDLLAISRLTQKLSNDDSFFAYIEDPFGTDQFDSQQTLQYIEAYRALSTAGSNIHVIVTSRANVYRRASSAYKGKIDFKSKFQFSLSPSFGKDQTYSLPALRQILARVAWLKGASWHDRYVEFINSGDDGDKGAPWDSVVPPHSAPGSLYTLMSLYPGVLTLDGSDLKDIRLLAKFAERVNDLKDAFNSELMNAASEPGAGSKLAFLLLPSITLVTRSVIADLFGASSNDAVSYLAGLLEERPSTEAFEVKSYKYAHDLIAEAARTFLLENGKRIILEHLLPWLNEKLQKTRQLDRVASDVLCTYFALGGNIDPVAERCLQRLHDEKRREWVNLTAVVFRGPSAGPDIVRSIVGLAGLPAPQISSISSLLDQLIRVNIEINGDNIGLGFVKEVLRGLLLCFNDESSDKIAILKGSLLLHGVLSHFEEIVVREPSSIELLGDLWSVLTTENRLRHINAGIVWLDAILMKLGELHSFLVLENSLDELSGEFGDNANELSCLSKLQEELLGLFLKIWREISGNVGAKQRDYLLGAMTFSTVWHNRWATADKVNEDVLEWANEACGFGVSDMGSDEYWAGVEFNMEYHSDYFDSKAEAWARESAIFMWRRREPRLGASSLYESGLLPSDIGDSIQVRHALFFSECSSRLLLSKRSSKILSPAAFILGMRAPRERTISVVLSEAVRESLRWEYRDQLSFWRGIALLYKHCFREAEALVGRALEPGILRAELTDKGGQPTHALHEAINAVGGDATGDLLALRDLAEQLGNHSA